MSKIIKIMLLITSLLLFFSIGIALAKDNSIVQKYIQKDEKEIQKNLMTMNKKQLYNEINSLATELEQTNDKTELIPFVEILFQRKNEFKNQEIINSISDNTSSITTKEIMIDLFTVKNENRPEKNEIKKLLTQSNIDKKAKARIVANTKFDLNDVNILKGLIEEDNGTLAFQSLKKLSKVNDKVAYEISSKILSNKNFESKEKVSASLKATARYIKNNKSNSKDFVELQNNFINLSLDIINTNKDAILKDSAFFAISDLMSKEAISQIIKNQSIDRELKVFAIDQNFMSLKEILLNNPTESDIEVVVEAMEILPIIDLADDLEKATINIQNKYLKQRSENVVKNMKANGRKANYKWLDKEVQ